MPYIDVTRPSLEILTRCTAIDIFFSRAESGKSVKLTTHLQLVPRSRKRGSLHPLLHYIFMA
jgi:hypothetical protein